MIKNKLTGEQSNDNRLVFKRVGINISLICNLKCKLCTTFSPYNTDTKFPAVDELNEYMDRLFRIADYAEHFSISGGEPLLYKQLPEFIENLLRYSEKIGRIEIVTNGTIIPNEQLLNVVKKFDGKFYRFLVDNYGKDLSTKIPEINNVLSKSGLPFIIRNNNAEDAYCGGWFDLGSLEKKIHSPEESEEVFSKCAQVQKINLCFGITKGILSPCQPVYQRLYLGQKVDPNDYIDLMDDSLSIEEQRKKVENIYHTKCFETCSYCNGWCEGDQRFVPAIQLTDDEIRAIKQLKIN